MFSVSYELNAIAPATTQAGGYPDDNRLPVSSVIANIMATTTFLNHAIHQEVMISNRARSILRLMASFDCEDHRPKCARCNRVAQDQFKNIQDIHRVASENKLVQKATRHKTPTPTRARKVTRPYMLALAPIREWRASLEKDLELLAAQLPVADWARQQKGFGLLRLGFIIGETGDLSNYATKEKVWKRMGLAIAPDGKAQRRVRGSDAIEMGFNPRRRAVMYVVGDCLIRQKGHYKAIYDQRKEYEKQAHPELPLIVLHRRAKRYMEKALLADLWQEWQRTTAA